FAGGRLQRLGGQLLLWGPGGVFTRTSADGDWIELLGESSRLLPTSDERRSALLVSGDTVRLFDRETRKFEVVDVPIPARDVSSARIVNGELWIGTSGYGVLVKALAPAADATVQAGR